MNLTGYVLANQGTYKKKPSLKKRGFFQEQYFAQFTSFRPYHPYLDPLEALVLPLSPEFQLQLLL